MVFELVEPHDRLAKIRVVGVGGAGGNAVNRMIEAGLEGVDFLAVNTDLQALRNSRAAQVIQIGHQVTRGLGSGGDPNVGRESVLEDEDTLRELLEDSDMVFVTAGMGGGTGTGAAPIVARIAMELGALTVGVVTKPFGFEGRVRSNQAEAGLDELRKAVDTLIVIPNERLLEVMPKSASMSDAFVFADNVLYEATRGIHDIIMTPHVVNLDFADVRSIMQNRGVALMGTGVAQGDDRAELAARAAISSPLLESVNIRGAEGVLVNITGGEIGLRETSTVMSLVQEAAGDQAHIIFGYGIDESLGDTLQVTVIATGFDETRNGTEARMARESRSSAPTLAAKIPDETFEDHQSGEIPAQDDDVPAEDIAALELEQARPQLRVMAAAAGAYEPVEMSPPTMPETERPVSESVGRFTFAEPEPGPELMPPPRGNEMPATHPAAAVVSQNIPSGFPEELPASSFMDADPGHEDARPAGGSTRGWQPSLVRRSPFASDGLRDELSEPAYTRKYMD